MVIIPVIDLCQGQVVHAVKGQRDRYLPIQSQLCHGADPGDILQAFLDIYPFEIIYIADLDAINGKKSNDDIINKLQRQFPTQNFWLDYGGSSKEEVIQHQRPLISQIIGSESGINPDTLAVLQDISPFPILSLDFKDGHFIGDHTLLKHPEVWPDNIIIMNLSRVGSGLGPDFELLDQIKSLASDKNFYIAGGIRNQGDFKQLKTISLTGVLIATALHNCQITCQEISEFI
ncbi:MAG: hypothetical protein HY356_07570 [Gammaproteobacteria bacterium]|nr:hypothetical protein [Gammaproteobacteria bacterium]